MKITDVIEAGIKGYSLVSFGWTLNNICQYRCSYCYAAPILTNIFETKYKDKYKAVLKRLSLRNIPTFSIDILGGEPTLHPNILDILEGLDNMKNCQEAFITTNLVKPISFYEELNNKNFSKIGITASYHPEYDQGQFAKKYIELTKRTSLPINTSINLHKDKKHWPKTIKTIQTIVDNDLSVSLNFLFSVRDVYDSEYTPEFYKFFSQYIGHRDNETEIDPVAFSEFDYLADGVEVIKIPYVTDKGQQYLNENSIQKNELNRFKGFYCTPLDWSIGLDGAFTNTCTGEVLDILGTNISKRIKCPVKNGCNCETMLCYHKSRIV